MGSTTRECSRRSAHLFRLGFRKFISIKKSWNVLKRTDSVPCCRALYERERCRGHSEEAPKALIRAFTPFGGIRVRIFFLTPDDEGLNNEPEGFKPQYFH